MDIQEEKKEEQTTTEATNETTNQSQEQSKGAGNFVKWAIIILIVAIVLIFAALKWGNEENQDKSVLATVGETEITMEDIQPELDQIKNQYLNQGIDITEEGLEDMILLQIVQNHINKVILLEYAKELDFKIEEEKIEEEYQKILTQFGGQEGLDNAMEQSQVTEENIRDDIRNSLTFQLIAEQEGGMEITEEEVQDRYQQLKEQLGDELPPIAEVYDQIEQEIMNEKMGAVLESIIDEVKESYDVEIFIETQPTPPVDQTPETPQGEEMTEEEIMEMLEEERQESEE